MKYTFDMPNNLRLRRVFCLLFACVGMLFFGHPSADEKNSPHVHDQHQAHAVTETTASFNRSEASYKVPDVTMVRQDGSKVSLLKELDDGRPVMINFIFTTCAAICPVLSHVFSTVQKKLGEESGKVHLVSISIDPEQDTPAHLTEYAKKFKAGPGWQFYTGTTKASIEVQKAFNAFRGDKMNHLPLVLMRAAPGQAWVRLEGLTSADDLIGEYHHLIGQK